MPIQELAERREKAEREEGERHDAAVAQTQKLVMDGEQRAKTADARAKETETRADQRRKDSEAEANEITAKAKSFAERTIAEQFRRRGLTRREQFRRFALRGVAVARPDEAFGHQDGAPVGVDVAEPHDPVGSRALEAA